MVEFAPGNMPFRRLGNSGLRVPVLSLGGWLTYGGTVNGDPVKEIIRIAFENGINMFDTAEAYSAGQSESEMGRVIKELGLRRTDLVISTKIFWSPTARDGPNAQGLSRKHIIEGTKGSLQRLQMDYVDVLFAHRCDVTVPMEEIVRAFNYVIEQGWAFYWGTSEWTAQQIEEAHKVAKELRLIAPIADQCQHNMFHRERPEKEYLPLYRNYNYGTTVWSPLDSGFLTGKYNDGIPEDSRYKKNSNIYTNNIQTLNEKKGQEKIDKVKKLGQIAQELECNTAQLALAWLLRDRNTSTVILGASKPEQILDNIKAIDVVPKLTEEVLERIEEILGNKPEPFPKYSRPDLDRFGRL